MKPLKTKDEAQRGIRTNLVPPRLKFVLDLKGDDVKATFDLVLSHGGGKIGEIASPEVEGVWLLTFVHCADPEGNIIELQNWRC